MSKRPNILLITSDQHRGDALGSAGHPCVRTPHLDQLAQMGIRFDRAYTDCPVCIPQRTTLVTGIASHVYGMPNYAEHYRLERDRELYLGSLMTKAGYQTELIGKTHWHTDPSFRAGFEHVYGLDECREAVLLATGRPVFTEGLGLNEMYPGKSELPAHYSETNLLIEASMQFLKHREKSQPFFLWASFQDPHPPNTVHEPYYSMYDDDEIPEPVLPGWMDSEECPLTLYKHRLIWGHPPMKVKELRKARGVYYGKITNLDHQLGRLLGLLRVQGELDDTWILYSSDHGEMLGDCGDIGKMSFLESSARVPLIVVPPKAMRLEPGRVTEALTGWEDLLPTLCEIADIDPPQDVTGQSLMPIIGGSSASVRRAFHGQIDLQHMLHDGEYKYMYFVEDGRELLFAASDREDRFNLCGVLPEVASRLRQALTEHLREEGSAHVTDDGLLCLDALRPTDETLKAVNIKAWPCEFG